MVLDRNAILGAKPVTRDVEVPAWGGDVRVKGMSITDRLALLDEYKQNVKDVEDYEADQALPKGKRKNVPQAELYDQAVLQLIHTIVDENGNRLFTTADYSDFKALDYATIQNLYRAFLDLNGQAPDTKKN